MAVMSSIRTAHKAPSSMYDHGLELLSRGFLARSRIERPQEGRGRCGAARTRFGRDVHALVASSASPSLMLSVRVVLVRLVGTILGVPLDRGRQRPVSEARPKPPTVDNAHAVAARERLQEITSELYSAGLGGEKFHVVFAEVMDAMMRRFVREPTLEPGPPLRRPPSRGKDTVLRAPNTAASSSSIEALTDWVENHFCSSRLRGFGPNVAVILGASTVSCLAVRRESFYQNLALGRLASPHSSSSLTLFSRGPNRKAPSTTFALPSRPPARRIQLTDSFTRTLQKKLLPPRS